MAVAIAGFTSFLLIALCTSHDTIAAMFYLSLVASVMMGVQRSIGETALLGFLKGFPGETIGYYGCGTGCAGVTASGLLILLKSIGMTDAAIYLVASPSLIPYFFAFWWLNKQKEQYPYEEEVPTADALLGNAADGGDDSASQCRTLPLDSEPARASPREGYPLNMHGASSDATDPHGAAAGSLLDNRQAGVVDNATLDWATSISILKRTGLLMSNLTAVYYLEYFICTGLTVAIGGKLIEQHEGDHTESFVLTNTFVIFNFCYQIGVFISRSTLGCFKIERVWILTLLQLINTAFWLSNSFLFYCTDIYIYFINMVFVGLMGGASFVNVIY